MFIAKNRGHFDLYIVPCIINPNGLFLKREEWHALVDLVGDLEDLVPSDRVIHLFAAVESKVLQLLSHE
jgi:hypothetical protein